MTLVRPCVFLLGILTCFAVQLHKENPVGVDPCGLISADAASGGFTDGCQRLRFFRGLNVVFKGIPWVPLSGADQFDPFLSMNAVDGALWESLGLNVVRLGVMWPGVQPTEATMNGTYLSVLTNLTEMLGGFGVYSLLDFHQDSLSGMFCGEGIPDWAAVKYTTGAQEFPLPVTSTPFPINSTTGEPDAAACSSHGWTDYYFSDALSKASQAIYSNVHGAADDFSQFWGEVASTFSSADWILGYELMNEPWAGDALGNPLLMVPGVADRVNLQPLWFNTTQVIRAHELPGRHRLVFVESVTWDDFFPVGFDALPGSAQGLAALSYHYYDLPNFNADWQLSARVKDALRLQAGALLTEFDFGYFNFTSLSEMMGTADKYTQGYIGWEYKSYVPITGSNTGLFTAAGDLDPMKVQAISRTFPTAVAGTAVQYAFDYLTGNFSLSYTANMNATAPTTVFMSTGVWYTSGLHIVVESVPTGSVEWHVEYHNSTAPAPPRVSARGWTEPQPLDYAILIVTNVNTAADALSSGSAPLVTVTIQAL